MLILSWGPGRRVKDGWLFPAPCLEPWSLGLEHMEPEAWSFLFLAWRRL